MSQISTLPLRTRDLVLKYVTEAAAQGRRLTCRELADLCGCNSPSTIHRHLRNLHRDNLLPEIAYTPYSKISDRFERATVEPQSRCGKTVLGITEAIQHLRDGSGAEAMKTLQGILSYLPRIGTSSAPRKSVAQ